ncbi:MAG: DUF1552 domain-containing protein, partial [Opitutae bacterium]|nr:DUF1552 domain-containing protein [Opitutae bacterium]
MSYIATKTSLNRRTFLKGTGATVALPFLSAMTPAFAAGPTAPKRFVAMNAGLGFHAPNFIPTKTGAGYQAPLYLQKLEEHRKDFTVFSGLSHPNSNGA